MPLFLHLRYSVHSSASYWTYYARYEKNSFVQQDSFYSSAFNFASEHTSWHNPWQRSIMAVSTYVTEALTQHTWIPAISRQSRLRTFSFFCSHLGELTASSIDATFIHVKKIMFGGNLCFTNHLNYQDTWVLELHWSLEFLEDCIFRAVWLKTSVSCKSWSANPFQQFFPFVQSVFNTAPLRIIKG